ncbi:MAG: hypothetical protein M3T56_17435 [Chloroflexota bacterium]|nr:hypothetical protein [Chloroflexota bacterium]
MISLLFNGGPFLDQFGPGVELFVYGFWIVGGYVVFEVLRRVLPWVMRIVARQFARSRGGDRG